MAVFKRSDRKTGRVWMAVVKRKGLLAKPLKKAFLTQDDAVRWEREQERALDLSGLPLTQDDLRKVFVADIVQRYLDEKTPHKGCAVSETLVLQKFKKIGFCQKSLAAVARKDAYDYQNARLKDTWKGKPIKPSTVRRELNTIQHIFETAREEWGYTNLVNPFRGFKVKGSKRRRTRRLKDGELNQLLNACEGCKGLNRFYVPLAINLAVETGMRLQEIFNLTWEDIDFEDRTIQIRRSKTDYKQEIAGRIIVMTLGAWYYLAKLAVALNDEKRYRTDAHVFPGNKDAFKQSWKDVKRRAECLDLQFRDLRREANSWFNAAGLTNRECEYMLGHFTDDTNSIYFAADLKLIREKLDKHQSTQRYQDIGDYGYVGELDNDPLAQIMTRRTVPPSALKQWEEPASPSLRVIPFRKPK